MMPDNYDLFLRHEAERENELNRLPRCTECGRRIYNEYCYEIYDELICEDCMNKYYRVKTEYYID